MSETNDDVKATVTTTPTVPRKTKAFRNDEIRAALQSLEGKRRHDAESATKATAEEQRVLRTTVLERVGDLGRQHQTKLAQLRDWREKRVRAIDKEHEEAVRRAKGDRVRALNDLEETFAKQRDEANQANTTNVAPCEAELRDTEARLAAELAATLAALQEECAAAKGPLIAEQQALEAQLKARATQPQPTPTEGAPGA
jgi:hypothetical protein